MVRQYDSPNYVVYETIINRVGDSFRMWIPKGVLVDDNIGMFPTFFSKSRGVVIKPSTTPRRIVDEQEFERAVNAVRKTTKRKSSIRRKRARSRN